MYLQTDGEAVEWVNDLSSVRQMLVKHSCSLHRFHKEDFGQA